MPRLWRLLLLAWLASLAGCAPHALIVRGLADGLADGLASTGLAEEDDPVLAREAAAFTLKLSESVLRQAPDHARLAEAVAAGFTQYAYAFVAFDADRLEARDARAAQRLRERAARLYRRAQRHAMAALAQQSPGFAQALAATDSARWPRIAADQVGLAYWAAAAWAGAISLSKDDPDAVADLPLAVRLATLAYATTPEHGQGALASLMGTLEAARPGGSRALASTYFARATAAAGGRQAGVHLAQAEALALPAADRAGFEALLRTAIATADAHPDLANGLMRERAMWWLAQADDLF